MVSASGVPVGLERADASRVVRGGGENFYGLPTPSALRF